jgi:hypothetical protein
VAWFVHPAVIRGRLMGLPSRLLPAGDLRFLYLHWTAGDYRATYSDYHVCVGLQTANAPGVFFTHDLRANMRDVRASEDPYAAHTAGRNSYAIGLAVCGMANATPHDFGRYPLREDFLTLACATAAELCAAYAIPIDPRHVRTHAEAALEDGYFGSGPDERWDIARLAPAAAPLAAHEAARAGDELRARIACA